MLAHPDGGFEKCFCRECGAHLFSRNPTTRADDRSGWRRSTSDPGVSRAGAPFTSYAPPWEPVPDDGLRALPEGKGR